MVQAVGQTLLDLVSDQRGGIDDDSDDDTEELLLPYVGKIIDYAKEIYTGNWDTGCMLVLYVVFELSIIVAKGSGKWTFGLPAGIQEVLL